MSHHYDYARASAVNRYKRELKKSDNPQCSICAWQAPYHLRDTTWKMLHIHHIVPVACGGSHERNNLAVLCANCHAIAHATGYKHKKNWHGPRTFDELKNRIELFNDPTYDMAGVIAQQVDEIANALAIAVFGEHTDNIFAST